MSAVLGTPGEGAPGPPAPDALAAPASASERAGPPRGPAVRFYVAVCLSLYGDWLTTVALLVVLFEVTHTPAAPAGYMVARIAPRVAGPWLGGHLTDRLSPRVVIMNTSAVQGGADRRADLVPSRQPDLGNLRDCGRCPVRRRPRPTEPRCIDSQPGARKRVAPRQRHLLAAVQHEHLCRSRHRRRPAQQGGSRSALRDRRGELRGLRAPHRHTPEDDAGRRRDRGSAVTPSARWSPARSDAATGDTNGCGGELCERAHHHRHPGSARGRGPRTIRG